MSEAETSMTAPGQSANRPQDIPPRGYFEIAIRVYKRVSRDQLGLIAAGIAFFGMLALFPTLTALVALGGAFVAPSQIVTEAEGYLSALPEAAREIVQGQMVELASADSDTLNIAALMALALAIYSSSKGMANLMSGLNVVYEETEKRGFFVLKAQTMALTLFAIVGGLIGLGVVAALPFFIEAVIGWQALTDLVLILRWPLMLCFASLGFAVIYRYGPSRRQARWRWIAPGSVLAVLIWVAATFGFAWYVQNFGSYNETFGALAGVVILLLWLWLSAYSILVGATVDAEMEAQTRRDSTIGEEQPIGQRGAAKADSCAAGSTELGS